MLLMPSVLILLPLRILSYTAIAVYTQVKQPLILLLSSDIDNLVP